MNNKKLIGVGLLSVLGLIGVALLVYAVVINGTAGDVVLVSPAIGRVLATSSMVLPGTIKSPAMMPMVITLATLLPARLTSSTAAMAMIIRWMAV
jgi:hypothetical protein